MQQISKNADGNLWICVLERPFEFFSPFPDQEYALLLISVATDTTHTEKDNLTRKIVETRCRYAVCTGHACELWHDYIDEAFVDSAPNFDPPNSRFVMTTWHEDEPVEDVVEFFRWNTVFEDFIPKNFLVLFVGVSEDLKHKTLESLGFYFRGATK